MLLLLVRSIGNALAYFYDYHVLICIKFCVQIKIHIVFYKCKIFLEYPEKFAFDTGIGSATHRNRSCYMLLIVKWWIYRPQVRSHCQKRIFLQAISNKLKIFAFVKKYMNFRSHTKFDASRDGLIIKISQRLYL